MGDKVALVTGASSGIGEALAEDLAGRGYRVAVVARRRERLQALVARVEARGGEAMAVEADVSHDGDLDAAIAAILGRWDRIDVAIANAGIGEPGAFERQTVDDFRRVLDTNVLGVVRTAHAVLPALTATRGSFAAVGSVSSYLAAPGTSAYTASKHAVRGLCAVLAAEWAARGVSVTHIAPGFVESEIRTGGTRRDPVPAWLVMPRETAARQISDAVLARRDELVVTGHGKVAVSLARHVPGLVAGALRLAARRVR
jgi:short-subunit dehydrogenase